MNGHAAVITKFYTAFARHDGETMARCYHPEIEFHDPVFGTLKRKEVSDMWQMLLERSQGNLKITFSDVAAEDHSGSAKWSAEYVFSKTGRKVTNHIEARFKFRDGLIIRHHDDFDLWAWSRQALGLKGFLLGWAGSVQAKIRSQARQSLKIYREKKRDS